MNSRTCWPVCWATGWRESNARVEAARLRERDHHPSAVLATTLVMTQLPLPLGQSTRPPPPAAISASAPRTAAAAIPCRRYLLSTNRQVIR